jgi:hypothetical protein
MSCSWIRKHSDARRSTARILTNLGTSQQLNFGCVKNNSLYSHQDRTVFENCIETHYFVSGKIPAHVSYVMRVTPHEHPAGLGEQTEREIFRRIMQFSLPLCGWLFLQWATFGKAMTTEAAFLR